MGGKFQNLKILVFKLRQGASVSRFVSRSVGLSVGLSVRRNFFSYLVMTKSVNKHVSIDKQVSKTHLLLT